VTDLDVAEERSAGEHDARRPEYARVGLHDGPAHLRAGLHLDVDALGHQQVDVAEQRTGVDVGLRRAELRLAQVELDVAEPRPERVVGRHGPGTRALDVSHPADRGGLRRHADGTPLPAGRW
jgi:hypothetical protein